MEDVDVLVRANLEPWAETQLAGAIREARTRPVISLTDAKYQGWLGLLLLKDDGIEFLDPDGAVVMTSGGDLPVLAEVRRRGTLDVTLADRTVVTFTDVGDARWTRQFSKPINELAGGGIAAARLYAADNRTLLATGEHWRRELLDCTVLGGYGYPIPVGEPLTVSFDPTGVRFAPDQQHDVAIPMADLTGIEIGGPGKVTEGGGFFGGGFGLQGAATGMAIAGILNALSTRTTVLTVVALTAAKAEVWFAYTQSEPAALRVELSPVFVAIRQTSTT